MGRPSLPPGRYFRVLLLGYFEGIDSERGMAWRAADSLAVRDFLRLGVDEPGPDHSTISRTRRLIDVETHRAVFTWVQQRLVEAGLLKGKTIAIDATTLEANVAMRSIVRRDTGEQYDEFLTRLAQESGIKTPTREALARFDRRRKNKASNQDWAHPWDPDAKITKMKDGRTHLAHKAEHAIDLDTGAIVAVTVQGADQGDTTSIIDTTMAAAEQVEDAQADVDTPTTLDEVVADKGYHSNETMIDLRAVGLRSYVSEPDRGRRDWSDAADAEQRRAAGRHGHTCLLKMPQPEHNIALDELHPAAILSITLDDLCALWHNQSVAWDVEGTDEFAGWFESLKDEEQASVARVVELLVEHGPSLPFPYSSGIAASRHRHMRELRTQHEGRPYRVLYAFDPRRSAILLLAATRLEKIAGTRSTFRLRIRSTMSTSAN